MTAETPIQDDPGVLVRRLCSNDYTGKPCLFLDRDGVVVEESHYLHRPEDVIVIDGVAEAIARANIAGVAVVMVTNQAGIGRGYYSWNDFDQVQQHILGVYGSLGARFDMILACAYHHEGVPPYNHSGHPWRKPAPGMLLEATRILGLDLTRSHIVGDTLADLAAGAQAGLRSGTLVLTGHGRREWRERGKAAFASFRNAGGFTPFLARNAADAVENWLGGLPSGSAARRNSPPEPPSQVFQCR